MHPEFSILKWTEVARPNKQIATAVHEIEYVGKAVLGLAACHSQYIRLFAGTSR